MQYNITAPEALNQTVKLPASKSISNRALIIYALSGGDILPDNLSDCNMYNVHSISILLSKRGYLL